MDLTVRHGIGQPRLKHSLKAHTLHVTSRHGLMLSFFINLCYAGFKLDCAVRYASFAVINTVKYRKFHSPVLCAAKTVNLTTALVSMFNLETVMIVQ